VPVNYTVEAILPWNYTLRLLECVAAPEPLRTRWQDHVVFLDGFICEEDVCRIDEFFATKLSGGRCPEQYKTLETGSLRGRLPSAAYLLQKVQREEGAAWLLIAEKASRSKIDTNRREAFYNGTLCIWQHVSTLSRLSYAEEVVAFYVGFEPPFSALGALRNGRYLLKLGFQEVRLHHQDYDFLRYIFKKPLNWYLEGAGLFRFQVPSRYHHRRLLGRTAEEDLKALFFNLEGATPCDRHGLEGRPYISGEYLTLPDDCINFQSMVNMLCTFAGTKELKPCTVRLGEGQSKEFALKLWSYSSLPLAISDVEALNGKYQTRAIRHALCDEMKAMADKGADGFDWTADKVMDDPVSSEL
jgi:hypothetical protein